MDKLFSIDSVINNTPSIPFFNTYDPVVPCVPNERIEKIANAICPKLATALLKECKYTRTKKADFFSTEVTNKKQSTPRIRFKNTAVHCETTIISIRLFILNRTMTVDVDSQQTVASALQMHNIDIDDRWWLTCRNKPLRLHLSFDANGCTHGSCIIFNERLRGGAALYNHVAIAEKEVVARPLSDAEFEKALEVAWEKYVLTYKMEVQTAFSFQLSLTESMMENITEEMDYYVKLAEDCMVMLYMMTKAQDYTEVAGAIGVFAKLRSTKSLSFGVIRKALSLAYEWFFGEQVHSNHLSTIRDILDNYESLKHSQLAERLHCFMMFALGHSLFDSIGLQVEPVKLRNLCFQANKEGNWKSADFAYLCIESIVFLCERGYQAYQLGSVQPLFHSGKNHEKWLDECAKLKLWSSCLGNPEPHGFTIFQ